ncbi:hypothetical protein D3C84_522940 [compost metagenome]
MDTRHQGEHAADHERAEHHRCNQRVAVDHAPAQRVSDQADRTKPHQAPPHHRAIETGQPLQDIGQIGVDGEHAAEHQNRQQHMPLHQRTAQNPELRSETHLLVVQVGFRQVDKQQQGLGEGNQRQNAEGTAPTECIRDQRADGNPEDRGTDDPEADLGNRPPGIVRPDDVHRRFTGQRPEHRQPQRRYQPGHCHHANVGRQGRQGVGQPEQDQHADKQPAAFKAREVRRQEWPERRHGKREQGHQQPRLGNADIKVASNRGQQADNDELRGQHRETGG